MYLVASLSIYRAMMMLLKPRRQGYWCAAIVLPTGYCCQLKLHVLAIQWGKEQRREAAWCCCCVCAAVVVAVGCVVDCERRRREQGGRESKEEVKFSGGAENYLTSHHFLPLSTLPAPSLIYSLRALMKPPINPLLPTYFSDLADLSHHISPIYSTSLLITSLIPLPISTSPEAEVVVRWLYLYWWSSHQQQNATNWVASLSRYWKRTTGKWQ